MEFLTTLLEQQPLMALFLTIAIGYLVGEINIKGFSLGVGAVLFVALFMGWFAPKSVPAPMVGTLGLALFLYGVGVQYGKQFFLGLTTAERAKGESHRPGRRAAGGCRQHPARESDADEHRLWPGPVRGIGDEHADTPGSHRDARQRRSGGRLLGLLSVRRGGADPAALHRSSWCSSRRSRRPRPRASKLLEIALRNPELSGKTLGDVSAALPAGVQIAALRRAGRNEAASPSVVVAENDVVLAVGASKDALAQARRSLGEAADGRLLTDRSDLDYLRVFASRPGVVGRALGDLDLPGGKAAVLVQVRRGDADIMPSPDLVLEFGDRVGVLAHRDSFPAMRQYFGDSIKGTAEFSYISIGIGMALGFLIGAIQIPLPGIGKLAVGLSGVLIVALILGNLRRTGSMNWTIPLSANLVLRNFGLTLFLAQVGMASGPKFAATVADTGFVMLGLGAVVLLALVLPILILGLFVFRMPYDEVAGIVAGACGNPAVLAYANRLAPTDKADIGYAMIFPGMTIVKILFVDIVPALL